MNTFVRSPFSTISAALMFSIAGTSASAQSWREWSHVGGTAARTSVFDTDKETIDATVLHQPAWTLAMMPDSRPISFLGQSGIVASRSHVFAVGTVPKNGGGTEYRIFAVKRREGTLEWSAVIDAPAYESIAGPTYDGARGTVLVPSGSKVRAFNASTGAPKWTTQLTKPIVNATAVVTDDLGSRNRAFVTEFDVFSLDGRLTCINIDPFVSGTNPYAPGQIVWSVSIGGSSGNSPAYQCGRVYVSTTGDPGYSPGQVLAFDARETEAEDPLWCFDNPILEGFYAPVCVADDARLGERVVYAASYAFYGGRTSANLVKIDASNGELIWSVPSNRSGSGPVVTRDGVIALAGGLRGYGTLVDLTLWRDQGLYATRLWNSAEATWIDLDSDGSIDANEYTPMGGWSLQAASSHEARVLFVGALPQGATTSAAPKDLFAIDTARLLQQSDGEPPVRVYTSIPDAGGSVALADQNLYTISAVGLRAFGPTPPRTDLTDDGRVDDLDLAAWIDAVIEGRRDADVNDDGVMDDSDAITIMDDFEVGGSGKRS